MNMELFWRKLQVTDGCLRPADFFVTSRHLDAATCFVVPQIPAIAVPVHNKLAGVGLGANDRGTWNMKECTCSLPCLRVRSI